MADECIFCNPDPKALIFKGRNGIVLTDGPCRAGHVLVGITGHHPSLHDAPPDQVAAMMQLAVKASREIVRLTGAEKTYVVAIGDKDKHFHVHLVPKMGTDPLLGPHVFGGKGWAEFLPPEPETAEVLSVQQELAKRLRA